MRNKSGSSGAPIVGVVTGLYRWYAGTVFDKEISLRAADGWTRHSWWRVVGLSLAFLVVLFLFAAIFVFATGKVRA